MSSHFIADREDHLSINGKIVLRHIIFVFLFAVMLPGCTWVKLTPQGEKVRVLSQTEVNSCKKLGITTVSVRAVVAGIERSEEKVKKELETLARNRAMDLNGDTVVPLTKVEKGQQTFSVYRCVNP